MNPESVKQFELHVSVALKVVQGEFQSKYFQLAKIGEGGFGSVYSGFRIQDLTPIKDGKKIKIPSEVALMLQAAKPEDPVGSSAAVSLLDWYTLDQEIILVMERPILSKDLHQYVRSNGGYLTEDKAKIILKQLVDAAIDMNSKGVFHWDIKCTNLLIETGSYFPRVRVIDFGCGCYVRERPYTSFCGTSAYFPPEWFSNRKYRACPTTVWQIGALLYMVLHGQKFDTKDFLRSECKISKMLSIGCQDFLEKCLTKCPKKRATLRELQRHPWLRPHVW
ncbi:hypothetical protein LDENG_00204100 [Lucifuga dentata]|nr:hypothetical protein LDENG_00204100 [Lucifuga dentata]